MITRSELGRHAFAEFALIAWFVFTIPTSVFLAYNEAFGKGLPSQVLSGMDAIMYGRYALGIIGPVIFGFFALTQYVQYRDRFLFVRTKTSELIGLNFRLQGSIAANGEATEMLLGLEPKLKDVAIPAKIGTSPGFIYVMVRADGVYKIGRSINPQKRRKQHQSDYGKQFKIITRFVVPDVIQFEKLALQMTEAYSYNEAGRKELRQMSQSQLTQFTEQFKQICREAVTK